MVAVFQWRADLFPLLERDILILKRFKCQTCLADDIADDLLFRLMFEVKQSAYYKLAYYCPEVDLSFVWIPAKISNGKYTKTNTYGMLCQSAH